MTQKVLIADKLDDICERILREKGIDVVTKTGLSKEELIEEIKDYEGLAVRSKTKVTADVIGAADKLKIIGRSGVGIDNIDKDAATKRGIAIFNTPDANSIPVSELVFGGMIALARSLMKYDQSTKKGDWRKGKERGKREIYGKTMGVVGLGHIGRKVAKRADGFGMEVIYYDPKVISKENNRMKVSSLEELFRTADYITLHIPSNENTRGMITKDLLNQVKEDAVFINTSRADIVKEGGLVAIMETKPEMGAIVDVHYNEKEGEKLLAKFGDRVVLTPHIGADTNEAQKRGAERVAKNIIEYLESGSGDDIINAKKVPERYKPYKRLAEAIAYLGCNILETMPNQIKISCYEELEEHSEAFLNSALMGVLKYNKGDESFINEINASLLGKKRGIEINKRKPDNSKGYGNTITLDLIANSNNNISIRGMIDDGKVRFMRIGEYDKLSMVGEGKQLLVMYDGSHGVLGAIGDVLASYERSAIFMNSGKDKRTGRELSFLTLETNDLLSRDQLNDIKEEILGRRGKIMTKGDGTYIAIKEGINVYQVKHLDFGKVS